MSLALGAIMGIVPLVGISTLSCTLFAIVFRLNLVTMQLANYLVYPLQIILIVPYLKGGQQLFGNPDAQFSLEQIMVVLERGPHHALSYLGTSMLLALTIWLLTSLPLVVALYLLFRLLLARIPLPGTKTHSSRQ